MADLSLSLIHSIFGTAFSWKRGFTTTGPNPHYGIDLPAPSGTPIKAVNGGEVIYAGWANSALGAPWYTIGGGNVVLVKTGNGLIENYAHLSSFAIKRGDIVAKGQVLGAVGSTGNSTGPHLHFAIFDTLAGNRGAFVDPVPFLNGTGLTAFQQRLKELGIPTDPNHVITETEATKIVGLYGFTPGTSFFKDRVTWFTDKTIEQAGLGGNTDQNVVTNPPVDIGGFLSTLTDPVTWFKVGAVILGLILVVKGSTTIVSKGSGA